MLISYVIPCYRSAQTIAGVVSEIETTMQREGRAWELILVDDASRTPSPGRSWSA